MKTVYLFDPETGTYKGEYLAQESPLEKGAFIVPTHAVEVQPPAAELGKRSVWDGSTWTQVDVPVTPENTPAKYEPMLSEITPFALAKAILTVEGKTELARIVARIEAEKAKGTLK